MCNLIIIIICVVDFQKHTTMEREDAVIGGVDNDGKYGRSYLAVFNLMPHLCDMAEQDLLQYAMVSFKDNRYICVCCLFTMMIMI